MNAFPLLEAWEELLPHQVHVSAGPYLSLASQPLTQLEKSSAGPLSADRTQELETGRFYAKQALSRLGIPTIDLPMSPSRIPLWPEGTIGSITHVKKRAEGGHCAAAVGRASDVHAIGIDAEYDTGFDARLWPTVLTTLELGQLRSISVEGREVEAIKRWCVKEAVTKAAQRVIEPMEIDTEPSYEGGWYEATTSCEPGSTCRWIARTIRLNGFILASVIVPR
mgnify:CR=1 FL=1